MNKTKGGAMLVPLETKSIICNGNLEQFIPCLRRACESIDMHFYDEAKTSEYCSFLLMNSIDPLGRIEVQNRPDERIRIIYTRYKRNHILSQEEQTLEAAKQFLSIVKSTTSGEEPYKPPDDDTLYKEFIDTLFGELKETGFRCLPDDFKEPKITGFDWPRKE
jgi:hypothetical protein